jgi:hypothetical protein
MRIRQALRRIQLHSIFYVRCNKKLTIICSSIDEIQFFSHIFFIIRNQQILKDLNCVSRVLNSLSVSVEYVGPSVHISANF